MKKLISILIVSVSVAVFVTTSIFGQIDDSQNKIDKFLSLFKQKEIDTLHIYCPIINKDTSLKLGALIDTNYYELFDKTITGLVDDKIENNFHDEKIYACYKFKISETYTGLTIIRQHAHNENSFDEDFNIDLMIFDNQKRKIKYTFEIARSSFYSSAYLSEMDAWFMDLYKDGKIDIVSRWKQWWSDDVTDIEHTSDYFNVYTSKDDFFLINQPYTNSLNKSKFELKNWSK